MRRADGVIEPAKSSAASRGRTVCPQVPHKYRPSANATRPSAVSTPGSFRPRYRIRLPQPPHAGAFAAPQSERSSRNADSRPVRAADSTPRRTRSSSSAA